MSTSTAVRPGLAHLRDIITKKPPCYSGTLGVAEDALVIFYGKESSDDSQAGRINPFTASEAALERLTARCSPATFGIEDQEMYDESYRKAWKLDATEFGVKLDVAECGLLDLLRTRLLEGASSVIPIRYELYNLNVYGKGSFFKAHKDTPRARNMFGSLVVVYPTNHDGGALTFRENDSEWTFDSARAIVDHGGPCVAYSMFFSDIDHEVAVVNSGYRITITYNLYFDDDTPSPHPAPAPLKSLFQSLLDDPTFLPDGGILGFGLRHVYPITKNPADLWRSELTHLAKRLKGIDADIMATCKALSLKARLWQLHRDSDEYPSTYVSLHGTKWQGDWLPEGPDHPCEHLMDVGSAFMIPPVSVRQGKPHSDNPIDSTDTDDVAVVGVYDPQWAEDAEHHAVVHWVTAPTAFTALRDECRVFGNHPELVFMYGHVVLLVDVGKPGKRDQPVATTEALAKARGG